MKNEMWIARILRLYIPMYKAYEEGRPIDRNCFSIKVEEVSFDPMSAEGRTVYPTREEALKAAEDKVENECMMARFDAEGVISYLDAGTM